MVVIRNVFRLKFGKAREAVALFKEGLAIQKRVGAGLDFSTRLLTDVTGPFYTVVLEITVPNLAAFEGDAPRLMGDKDWQANYQKIGSLVESGYRESSLWWSKGVRECSHRRWGEPVPECREI
ncbi:MAG: NIPSNAP family protein [Acidobacteria bacterium]|nr:NIPSNAP family protein [Acidobacteriota bacterium]